MDNPVELAFLDTGEKFFTSTFLQHPKDGLRDGIGHAVYGSVFGKDHHVINGLTRTGPLMRPMTHLGPAAPSGLLAATTRCRTQLGVDSDSQLLVAALFNLHKVTVHQLAANGASYESVDHDLISTNQVDVHPTDVIEDRDGNLLMIDTGGWYDLCCPTSRVDQQAAAGGIYRIEPVDEPAGTGPNVGDVRWVDLSPEEVIELLHDARPWIRRSATRRLSQFGDEAIPACLSVLNDSDQTPERRKAAIWALCRINTPLSAKMLVEALEFDLDSLLVPILHAIGVRRIPHCESKVASLLEHPSLAVRRVAAQVLGRVAGEESVQPLLVACDADSTRDRLLQHSLIYALVEIGRRHDKSDMVAQADTDAALHAALTAARELGWADRIESQTLLEALNRDDEALQSTAISILVRRPDAAPQTIERLRNAWSGSEQSLSPDSVSKLLASWRDHPAASRLLDDWYSNASQLAQAHQHFLAEHMNLLTSPDASDARGQAIADWLDRAEEPVQFRILTSLRDLQAPQATIEPIASTIMRHAAESSGGVRLRWLASLPPNESLNDGALADSVIEAIVAEDSTRALQAARVLERARLGQESLQRLVDSLGDVSARHLSTVIEAVDRSDGNALKRAMLDKLLELPSARTLPEGYLNELFRQSSADLQQKAEEISRKLVRPSVDIENAVARTLIELPPGDPVRGLQVFRGGKAACSSCHRMGYIGEHIGPELTRIGNSRTPEALLEAILFPSSRLEQSYRSTQVITVDGQVYNGLVEHRRDGLVRLRLDADRTVDLRLDAIDLERSSDISVMPSGLDELLTPQELADLLSLLQSAK